MLARNPGKFFIKKDVQKILIKLTGCNLNKLFAPSFNPGQKQSQIELLTDEQLQQENLKTLKKATRLLQMPPFLASRVKTETILAHDQKLEPLNFTNTNYVFTDISLNVPNKQRMVVVREPNGVLRKADYDEREKMIQIYFPKSDKPKYTPKLFEPLNLEECLKKKHYLIVLNKACVRYEPNDPEFNRITHRVYEYINEKSEFGILHSTRFFGPMLFYLVWFKKVERIFAFLLENGQVEECSDIINLYNIVHEIKRQEVNMQSLEAIKQFIKKELNNSELCLEALQQLTSSNNKSSKATN